MERSRRLNNKGVLFNLIGPLLALGIICLSYGLSAASSDTYKVISKDAVSIEEAILMALKTNPDISMVAQEVKMAEASLKKTESLFLPRISVYSEYSTGDAPSAYLFKTIDQRDLPPGLNFNTPGSFTNLETGVVATWNIYKGGVDTLNAKIAQSVVSNTSAGLKDIKNKIVASVIQLFFSVLKAEEYVSITGQSVETVAEQLRIMGIRFEGGGVLKSDLLSLQVRLAEAKKDLVQAKNMYTTTLTAFNRVLGKTLDDNLILSRTCECPVTFPKSCEEAIILAMEKRPEIIQAKERLKMARMALEKAGAGYLPRIDFNARYYIDDKDLGYDIKNDNYTAAVTMNWDIYTGMSTKADLSRARHGLKGAEQFYRKVELDIIQDVRNAYLNLEDAVQRFEVSKSSVALADESLSLVKSRYEGGSAPVTRYLEAELARSRASMNKTAAFYDQKIALSGIGRSLGMLSQIWSKIEKQEN